MTAAAEHTLPEDLSWQPVMLHRKQEILQHLQTIAQQDLIAYDGIHPGILYHAYLQQTPETERFIDDTAFEEHLQHYFAQNSERWFMESGLFGRAWLLKHIFGDENPDIFEFFDQQLSQAIEASSFFRHELLYGETGKLVYLLEDPNSEARIRMLERVIERLQGMLRTGFAGIGFYRGFTLATRLQDEAHLDTGIAHGIGGPIFFLSKLKTMQVVSDRHIDPLLNPLLETLMKVPIECPGQIYPTAQRNLPGRLAWCLGPLAVAHVLVHAGRWLNDSVIEARGHEIAEYAIAARETLKDRLVDGSLCHGTASAAHMFNRLYHFSGVETYRTEAVHYYERTLDDTVTIAGVSLFPSYDAGTKTYKHFPSVLTGHWGVGLVLYSAITDIPPNWDACLALS